MKKYIISASLLLQSFSALAVQTTGHLEIKGFRVMSGGDVYIMVGADSNGLCSGPFKLPANDAGQTQLHSTALSAFHANETIRIELTSSGCTGYGTKVGSLFVGF